MYNGFKTMFTVAMGRIFPGVTLGITHLIHHHSPLEVVKGIKMYKWLKNIEIKITRKHKLNTKLVFA